MQNIDPTNSSKVFSKLKVINLFYCSLPLVSKAKCIVVVVVAVVVSVVKLYYLPEILNNKYYTTYLS
jgi:hypothetical protein